MNSYQCEARKILQFALRWKIEGGESPSMPFICIPHSSYGNVKKASRYARGTLLENDASCLRHYMESAGYVMLDEHHDRVTARGIDFAESTVFNRHQFWFGIILGASLSFMSAFILFVLNYYLGRH